MSKTNTFQRFFTSFSYFVLVAGVVIISFSNIANAQGVEEVKVALSGYHDTATKEQLEALAGGADSLVPILLTLRTLETPPFVAVRAEKMLLNYANRPEVAAALGSDLQSSQYTGLARVISLHIDRIGDTRVRSELARKAVSRAKTDQAFEPYTRSFSTSSDAQVREAAKSLE